MKARTEDRRRKILSVAAGVFEDLGFERASMAEISKRLGGSKATLYGYFATKEELFAAYVVETARGDIAPAIAKLDPAGDLASVLTAAGAAYVALALSEPVLAVARSTCGAPGTTLSKLVYEQGPRRAIDQFEIYLRAVMEKGLIREGDPRIAALHLRGMLDAGLAEPALYGAPLEIAIDQAVAEAVAAFLRAYQV